MQPDKLNVYLLMKVKKHILQKPSRLRMGSWYLGENTYVSSGVGIIKNKKGKTIGVNFGESTSWGEPGMVKFPTCGTVGCIAGWTVLLGEEDEKALEEYKKHPYHIETRAAELLDIHNAGELFYVSYWPDNLKIRYYNAKTQRERAELVGERIDLWIKEYLEATKQIKT